MRIFVTGATGFIGSAIVPDLLEAGHQVLGLARSESGAQSLIAAGAQAQRGDLEDLDSLRRGAAMADGVIHVGFNHDFSRFAESCEADRRAIEAIGEVLEGTDKPLVVTAGLPVVAGRPATEDDPPSQGLSPRVSEETAEALAARGVRASVVRLPQVHDQDKHGLASYLIGIARQKAVSAYVGDGLNRWSAAHRLDVAPLFRLALDKGEAGARYHAVAEEGVALCEIAEAIGRGLGLPVASLPPDQMAEHFGGLAFAVATDFSAASALTQQRLMWRPIQKHGFLSDVEQSSAYDS
ncbi:MAG: Nucleoside-diphosphate-sugar epimerases [uncultured Sphingomonas sp.]|uniref:Nucleoside-diphosphate-sugar epimerases n=1 Tax=uncultured Sphingomonas sp. TaxID=158754 RepID=A0A6J4T9K4_9SPHN|nr:SDR family oxidoreductase [uncultured Sphingomonas sp.]CAA9517491.1 MAG: Nucleoside-diphosphate-sugar epimerases [uncultured Sphingomonas sp.]